MEKLNLDPAAVSSTPSTDNLQRQNSRKSLILRCQRILFSAYRTDQYADPDGFLMSLGAVLEQYPDDVVVHVTDPRTGVQRGKVFPPTIAEIVEACDAKVADIERTKRYKNWGKNDATALLDAPKHARPTLEQLRAKYGENYGLGSPEKPTKSLEQKKAEQAAALVEAVKRVDAEYAQAGLVKPSRFALSLSARKEMAERDELRESMKRAAE